MSAHTKNFEYQENGLSYTVTLYEKNGEFFADITVNDGAMDVNAIYFGDDDMSGPSASLKGPLNMNGAGAEYDGEAVQWDDALRLSDPGLGKAGTDKETFVTEGDTLTISLPITSLDDIDFFGIRATSTTTDSGSIKGVSGDPETPDDPLYEKVFFDFGVDENGDSNGGVYVTSEAPESNPFNVPALPEGTEPTFENYLSYFEERGGDPTLVDSVAFYETDADGALRETFRIDAPEGGFADAEAILAAYDEATEPASSTAETSGDGSDDPEASESDPDLDLMAAISVETPPEDPAMDESDDGEDFSLL